MGLACGRGGGGMSANECKFVAKYCNHNNTDQLFVAKYCNHNTDQRARCVHPCCPARCLPSVNTPPCRPISPFHH